MRQSARTVSALQLNSRAERTKGSQRPQTLLEGVQASIDYSRSGAAKKAAMEELRKKKLREKQARTTHVYDTIVLIRMRWQARAVRSLNLTNDQLDEFRQAFALFDKDASGQISTRELAVRQRSPRPTTL